MPTPRLAHALTALNAHAGVMVTASHNPPSDNGYKVYWRNGAQIVPPHDRGISSAIDRVDPSQIEVADLADLRTQGLVREYPTTIQSSYLQAVLGLRVHRDHGIRAVYSAMHGVGYASLQLVIDHTDHHLIRSRNNNIQTRTSTVRFPNPEEPGALDRAIAQAKASACDLIIAHDPDADRLAVAVRQEHGWRQLSGNQVGALLADDLLEHGTQLVARSRNHGRILRLIVQVSIPLSSRLRRNADRFQMDCQQSAGA